jgi:hypothetical protein
MSSLATGRSGACLPSGLGGRPLCSATWHRAHERLTSRSSRSCAPPLRRAASLTSAGAMSRARSLRGWVVMKSRDLDTL